MREIKRRNFPAIPVLQILHWVNMRYLKIDLNNLYSQAGVFTSIWKGDIDEKVSKEEGL